jgi:hypothetical protein
VLTTARRLEEKGLICRTNTTAYESGARVLHPVASRAEVLAVFFDQLHEQIGATADERASALATLQKN